jgi:16S rRNA (cytosine967-C5)-methyltransferase
VAAASARGRWAPGSAALARAASVVEAVVSRGEALAGPLSSCPPAERSAVQAISFGTLRWYLRLAPAIDALLTRPRDLATAAHALLVTAAHQIEYSRNVPEATVNASVDAARILGQPRASGLINAVLRRYLREHAGLLARGDTRLAVRTAHPQWLTERIQGAWPDAAAQILEANNIHPPMTLRVDLSRTTPGRYHLQLAEAGIESEVIQWSDCAITLTHPRPVEELPGFAEGTVSVQDAGAQLAAPLLAAGPGMRVLDACAAPGGKTGALLERLGDGGEVVAVELDAARAALIEENLARLGRSARVLVGDAREAAMLATGGRFERILIDAPCSSTGVIRRHPDIKLLRRPGDLRAFATLQLSIARAAAAVLAPAGRLVYSTCSVLPDENEAVVGALLEAEPELRPASDRISLPPGAIRRRFGWQLLPGAEAGTDGFYYACLEKTTAATPSATL